MVLRRAHAYRRSRPHKINPSGPWRSGSHLTQMDFWNLPAQAKMIRQKEGFSKGVTNKIENIRKNRGVSLSQPDCLGGDDCVRCWDFPHSRNRTNPWVGGGRSRWLEKLGNGCLQALPPQLPMAINALLPNKANNDACSVTSAGPPTEVPRGDSSEAATLAMTGWVGPSCGSLVGPSRGFQFPAHLPVMSC